MQSELDLLKKANIDDSGFPYSTKSLGLVKRWKIPIAVKTCGDRRAEDALDAIEKHLGKVFDRDIISNLPDDEIESGIIFCFGQAGIDLDHAKNQGMSLEDVKAITGTVSGGPGARDFPRNFLADDGEIHCRLYINLDNMFRRKASTEIAIHELGHAMGLGEDHFEGFGDDNGAVGEKFFSVLKLLYDLPIGKYAAD